jgi:hypothetical protein
VLPFAAIHVLFAGEFAGRKIKKTKYLILLIKILDRYQLVPAGSERGTPHHSLLFAKAFPEPVFK